ncbi:hypothetical protein [Bacillus thuringiensis]|nr:hypothetical protein [Bacillus thuringiensis]
MERKIDKEFERATQMLDAYHYKKQVENLIEYLIKGKGLCTLIQ